MALNQFFILSPRGDPIIFRDYRGGSEKLKEAPEIFFREIKRLKGQPAFNVDGINFCYVKQFGLFFVCTTIKNLSPAFNIELLKRLSILFKDYCGTLNEESVRKNFVLIYELLDEVIDFGYPQVTSTEQLKPFVFNVATPVEEEEEGGRLRGVLGRITEFGTSGNIQAASSANKPINLNAADDKKHKNEIFVDLVERLTILFSPQGNKLRAEIDGYIKMTSYLQGNPEVHLGLNEELVIGKGNGYGIVTLDDINFHQCVRLDQFDRSHTITFVPPEGEFTVLNYRISDDFAIPFHVYPLIEEMGADRVDFIVKIRLDIPEDHTAVGIVIRCPVPKAVESAKCELSLPGVTYTFTDSILEWKVQSFEGGSELFLRSRMTLNTQFTEVMKKEFGPINMDFEIPMYNCSNVEIRHLRVLERDSSYNPQRWVRNMTLANSYVCRV